MFRQPEDSLLHQLAFLDEESLANFCEAHGDECYARSIQELLEQRILRLIQDEKNLERTRKLCEKEVFSAPCDQSKVKTYLRGFLYPNSMDKKVSKEELGKRFLVWVSQSPSRKKALLKHFRELCGPGQSVESLLTPAAFEFREQIGSLLRHEGRLFDIRGFFAHEGFQHHLFDICQ